MSRVQVKTAVCDLIVRAAAAQPDIGLLVINTLNRSSILVDSSTVRQVVLSVLFEARQVQFAMGAENGLLVSIKMRWAEIS